MGQARVSHFACLRLIFRLTAHAGQSLPSLGPEKLPEIIDMVFSSPHPTSSLTLISRTLVLKILWGGASHIRTALGLGVGGKGDAEAYVPVAQARLELLGEPLEEA